MSLIGKQIGNYLIKAKLGEGGMGAVYLGEHPLIGKRVAVKVLLEELAAKEDIVTRFFNEAKAVNDIGHQNIVDIVDFGKVKSDAGADVVYFIMEYLDGESLAARLGRTGLAFNETMHVMTQCCSALAASHVKGIVHRDLKPENIYLCTRGADKNFTKILDFGIAKLTGDGGTSSSKTRTGLVIGTPTYMSPEQCEGKGLIDARSDIYSLGVVMYELLTGRVPFPGDGFGEILVAHLTKEPEPPSQLNPETTPELEAIVMHAIEKDKNRRFQTMDEFGAAVADASAHLASYTRLPSYAQSATSQRSATGLMGAHAAGVGPTTSTGTRPTTLSGSAAEIEGGPAKKSRAALFIGLAVVVAAGVGVAVLANGKHGGAGPTVVAVQPGGTLGPAIDSPAKGTSPTGAAPVTPSAIPTPVGTAKDERNKISLSSDPAGAEIVRAGKVLGVTPLDIDVTQGEAAFEVEVRKTGFVSQRKVLETDRSREISLSLKDMPGVKTAVLSPQKKVEKHGPRKKDPRLPVDDSMGLMTPTF